MEPVVKSPAIRTPVAAKNDHQQLVGATGALPGSLKIGCSVSRRRIEVRGGKHQGKHLNCGKDENQSTQ
jgi:hypothetical protein